MYGSMTTADTLFAWSAAQAARISCSTASWSPASIVSRMSSPGAPGILDDGRVRDRPARRRRAGRGRSAAGRRAVLVELLDAVLADAVAVDEAEELRRERRVRARRPPAGRRGPAPARGPRPSMRRSRDRGPDPVGGRRVEGVGEDDVLAGRTSSALGQRRRRRRPSSPRMRDELRRDLAAPVAASISDGVATSRSRSIVVARTTTPVRS